MKFYLSTLTALVFCLTGDVLAEPVKGNCGPARGMALQVLGSGGPIADDARASSGYLLWIDGKSRFLIDAGGGVFLRFGQAGARFEDLNHIAISHFHTDHSTDLPALLKSGYFSNREQPLPVSGPAAGGDYPGINAFLTRLLDEHDGAYAYLDGYLDGSDGLVELVSTEVDTKAGRAGKVYQDQEADIEITAMGVPHGPVPALSYRIRIGQKSIVFSGDQNGNSEGFIDFARDVDLLVMHMPVPEGIGGVGRKLHAPPSLIGKIAAETGTATLILSHFMARSLTTMEESIDQIRSRFDGIIVAANDLDCVKF